jgi:subtilase family serine protease
MLPFFRKSSKALPKKTPRRKFVLEIIELETRVMPTVFTPTFVPLHTAIGNMPFSGSGTPSGTTPSQMRTAYGVNLAMFGTVVGDGTGQTIAIVDAYNQPNIASDLAAFDSYFSLAAPPSLTVRNQTGGTSLPANSSIGGWSVEITLDVEWAHVIAPNASILLIEANSPSDSNLYAAVDTARNFSGVSVVSMSWGGGESSGDTSSNSHFTTPSGHNGVTFFASSGDSGAGVIYPSSSPNVVAVGGTSLFMGSGGSYSSESGWSGSGGGISSFESQPSYQTGVVTQSTTNRTTPDIAMDADPGTGVPIFDTYDNSVSTPWATYGGTSLASPMWAGIVAIANQGRVQAGLTTLDGPSGTLPKIYGLTSSNLHDITTGNNGFAAGAGYDLVTGRGTPKVNTLVNALVGIPPTVTGLSPTSGSVSGGTSVVITGANFNGVSAVNFGTSNATTFTVISATQIMATSPTGGGVVDVTVVSSGGTSSISSADHFTYVGPVVTSLSPTSGPAIGGTSVTITGTGFSGATAVKFGATSAVTFTVNSVTQITATAPAGTGVVDVTVTSPSGTSVISSGDHFTYISPVVTSLSPTSGPTAGGTSVTITGTAFTGASAVKFGATSATTYTVNSATQITATDPAGTGVVDVTVTTPSGGTSTTSSADHFTYVAPPTITGLNPTSGPATGGTIVTITGTGFTGASAVKFGATSATTYTVNSATQITATDPAGSGVVDVTVTIPAGGTSATSSADHFTYIAIPSIGSFTVSPTSIAIGATVTLTAANVVEAGGSATITGVNFYRNTNGASGLQIGSDTLIGGGTPSGTTWTLANVPTAGLTAGSYTYFAVATDSTSANSAAASTSLTVTTPGPVLAWSVTGQTNFGTQGLSAATIASGVTNSLGLTRGSGVTTSGTAANNAWGGKNWNSTSSGGISNNEFASFGLTVGAGKVVSLSTIDMNYRRGSSGPSNGYWQYQINGGSWNLIGDFTNEFSSSSSSGATLTEISLASISGLHNLSAGTVVNIRVVPYGATSNSGTWYVYDLSGNDLALGGTVSAAQAATTTTISSNTPSPSSTSQTVTFNVTVSGSVPNGETVTLDDASNNNAAVGTGTLSSGATTITVAAGALSVGTHNLFAVYGGDANFAASQSATVSQTVNNAAATTTTITSHTPDPSAPSQTVAFNVTVSGAIPDGETVTLKDASNGNTVVGTGTLASAAATITVAAGALSVGTHNIFAVYGGDANFASSQSANVTQTVVVNSTTTTITSNSPNPATTTQAIVFGISVSGGVPDGDTVTLEDAGNGNAQVGPTGAIIAGAASITVPAGVLSAGNHSIFAVYGGDPNFASSQSTSINQAVNLTSTTVTLVDNGPNPSSPDQAFSLTAAITPAVPDNEAFVIRDASNNNAIVSIGAFIGGTATLSIPSSYLLTNGAHYLYATYHTDNVFASSQSNQVSQTVLSPTSTTLADNGPNPSTSGQAVSFTATVSGGSAIDGETVFIEDASNANAVVASPTLSGNTVTFTISNLSVGTHNLFAVYNGDATNAGSNSSTSPVSQVVNSTGSAPAWLSGVVNGGTPQYVDQQGQTLDISNQNSVVLQILVTFNEPVTLAPGAFSVINNAGAVTVNSGPLPNTAEVDLNAPIEVGDGHQWIVTFANSAGTHPNGNGAYLIDDGLYTLHIDHTKVQANAQTMAADNNTGFWALYGDITYHHISGVDLNIGTGYVGDGYSDASVGANDFTLFKQHYNADSSNEYAPPYYFLPTDADLNGSDDSGDYVHFKTNYNADWQF